MRLTISAIACALITFGSLAQEARAQRCMSGSTTTGTTSTGTGGFTTNRVSPFSTGLTAAQINAFQQAMLFRQMQQAALQQQMQQSALQQQALLQAQAQAQFQPNAQQFGGFGSMGQLSPTMQFADTQSSSVAPTKQTAAERREARKQIEAEKKLARQAIAAEKAAAKATKKSTTSSSKAAVAAK